MATTARLRRIVIPLTIMLTIVGSLHYFIYTTAVRSLGGSSVPLAIPLILGLLLIPASLIMTSLSMR